MRPFKKLKILIKNYFKEDVEIEAPINKTFISVNGIEKKNLENKLYSEIVNCLMKAPLESRPMACSCIKKEAGYFFGIFRIGSIYGHYTKKVYGNTPSEVVNKLIVNIKKDLENFPNNLGSYPSYKSKCQMKSCPSGYATVYTHKCFF